eukprot:5529850-Ditylum_brightwellii.AAC.1
MPYALQLGCKWVESIRKSTNLPKTLTEALTASQASRIWATSLFEHDDQGRHIADAISIGKALLVSDRLFKNGKSTTAFIIEGGKPNQHRGELTGLYMIVAMANAIYKLHNLSEGKIPVHVKGHQDDFQGPMDRLATLNVEMDAAVKERQD